ncbi:MAG TPA: hypothetical protein VKY56_11220 [Chloroflexota bacterium]|jgi:hypothetical protein|nr:hypothetical protein [Chloroflexota bacterium]
MIQRPAIGRSTAVWAYRSLWLLAMLLVLAMPIGILVRGDVWLGPAVFTTPNQAGHSLIVIGGDVTLREGMEYPLVVLLGDVRVHGVLQDVLVVAGGNVYLDHDAVAREAVLTLGGQVFRANGAVIEGTVGAALRGWDGQHEIEHGRRHIDLGRQVRLGIAAGLGLLLLCLITAAAVPWSVVVTAATIRNYPVRSVLAGVTGLLVMPFVLVPLMLSLEGLPIAVLLGLGAVLMWLVGLTGAGFVAGQRLLQGQPGPSSFLRVLIVGLAPLLFILAVPIIGPLVVGAAGILGAGARIVGFVERERAIDALATVIRSED